MNSSIAHLDLSRNNLQDVGVAVLMKAIKRKDDIIHINLGQNALTVEGTKKLFKSLLKNDSVVSINIGNPGTTSKNRVGDKAVAKIVEIL